MDILNFISWIKGGRVVTTVDPAQTLLPVGLKDNRRDDGYLAGAISVEDLAAQIGGSSYTYEIGEYVPSEGGIIFHRYLEAGFQNYLVIPIVDQSISQIWSNIDSVLIGPSAQSTWDGLSNSNAIVGQVGHTNSAAQLCLNLVTGGQSDWYLPSVDELSLLWHNRFNVNKSLSTILGSDLFTPQTTYWSSTESNYMDGYHFFFYYGFASAEYKGTTNYVRAVRTFTI